MKRKYTFLLLMLMSGLLSSCVLVEMIEAERPVSYNSNNIYKDLKMDLFKGFVNNISVEDLVKDHRRPDTILDAEEIAAVEGYDIYQYIFPDGTIDCYVPKIGSQKQTGVISNDSLNMTALVDYIYYEPNKNIPLNDFILNDSLRSLIPTEKSVVFYLGDYFYDIVRIRLAKNNKNEILNMALNDVSMLNRDNNLSEFANEVIGKKPVSLGDLGTIMKTEYTKNMLSFSVVTNHCDINLKQFNSQNPSWANILVIRLFDEQCGIFRWMTDDIISKGAGITITLVDEKSNETIRRTVDYSSFKDTFMKGISNIERLEAFTLFENLTYPYTIQKMTCEKLRIEDNYLILTFCFSETIPKDYDADMSRLKKYEIKQLLDPENPERDKFALCHKCNYGVKKVYTFVDREIVIKFTPEEVKNIMKGL